MTIPTNNRTNLIFKFGFTPSALTLKYKLVQSIPIPKNMRYGTYACKNAVSALKN